MGTKDIDFKARPGDQVWIWKNRAIEITIHEVVVNITENGTNIIYRHNKRDGVYELQFDYTSEEIYETKEELLSMI